MPSSSHQNASRKLPSLFRTMVGRPKLSTPKTCREKTSRSERRDNTLGSGNLAHVFGLEAVLGLLGAEVGAPDRGLRLRHPLAVVACREKKLRSGRREKTRRSMVVVAHQCAPAPPTAPARPCAGRHTAAGCRRGGRASSSARSGRSNAERRTSGRCRLTVETRRSEAVEGRCLTVGGAHG